MTCEYLRNGFCEVASQIAGVEVRTTESACKQCIKHAKPRQPNDVTAGLAVKHDRALLPSVQHLLSIPVEQGPGTELKRLISWFWSPKRKCSTCSDRVRKMNKWGTKKCRQRKHLIVAWLRQSAEKEGLPFSAFVAGSLIDLAITTADRKQAKQAIAASGKPADPRWAVAVTTAPRKDCTLERCLASITNCGWTPTVFAEPGSTQTQVKTVWNEHRRGVWGNFLHSAKWCIENTEATWIMTVQDDSLFHPDSKVFIEQCMWPSPNTGFISLYTPKHYTIRKDGTVRNPGINRIATKSLWGACALVWPREVLEQVVSHRIATEWAGASPRRTTIENGKKRRRRKEEIMAIYNKRRLSPETIANSDTAIGKILNALGKEMYFVDPSPVQHIAEHSTIGHGGNRGRRNAWRIADYDLDLFSQVPIKHTCKN